MKRYIVTAYSVSTFDVVVEAEDEKSAENEATRLFETHDLAVGIVDVDNGIWTIADTVEEET